MFPLSCRLQTADCKPKPNVPISKCATTYTFPSSGNSVILVANQVLWLGNKLHCLLINPHHIRSYGYSVSDDPWDHHQPLVVDLEGIFIPLLASRPNLSSSTCVSRRIGKWKLSQLSKLRLQFGTQRICKCPDCFHFEACHQLDINRSPGNMVRIGDTSVCNLTLS
jgi:hypothetical protein